MKKILYTILIIILPIFLVGCNNRSIEKDSYCVAHQNWLLKNMKEVILLVTNRHETIQQEKSRISDDLIDFSLKEGTLTSEGATFLFFNKTEEKYGYGYSYFLEFEKNNKWYILMPIEELAFTMPLFYVHPKETREINLTWEYAYGSLSSGKYRIIKDILTPDKDEDAFVAAEFVIE